MTDDKGRDGAAAAQGKRERRRWRDAPPEERAAAYEEEVGRKFWRPRLPLPWRVRGAKARQRDWRKLRSWAENSWETVRPRVLGAGIVSGALKGGAARERRLLGEEASRAEVRFAQLRLVSGVLWLCVLVVLGAMFIAAESFFGQAGALGGIVMSSVLGLLCLRADWALVRLRSDRAVGLLEYVKIRLTGG